GGGGDRSRLKLDRCGYSCVHEFRLARDSLASYDMTRYCGGISSRIEPLWNRAKWEKQLSFLSR
ncbi:MAG: hypothetical protein WB555_14100, partial [Candidatus Korobacteraceae bacterium]